MATCEICGKKVEKTRKVKIDRIVLEACSECAGFGEPVETEVLPTRVTVIEKKIFSQKRPERRVVEEYVLIEDYPENIRKARQSSGILQKDLAKMINEKQSVISKIEGGEFTPDDALVKKLEKALKINLKEEI